MLRTVAVGSVVTGLVLSLLGSATRLAHTPSETDMDAVATAVQRVWRDGDVLVASPPWMLGTRRRLGHLPMLDPASASEPALWRYSRAVVVRESAIWTPFDPMVSVAPMRAQAVPANADGVPWPPRVQLFELSHGRHLVFDAYDQVDKLTVTAHYADAQATACDRWDRDRWSCPRDAGWNYVGRQILDIGGAPRKCLWLHPLADGAKLEVALPVLPAASATRLVGGYGFSSNGAKSARAPVQLSVRDGQAEIIEIEHQRSSSWKVLDVALPAVESHELVVTVTSRDNGAAHFCADLFVVREESR